MNRIIKFRVWDKELNLWVGDIGMKRNNILTDGTEKRFEVMEFTGFIDARGKEVCEGDVIAYGLEEGLGQPKRTGLKRVVKYSPFGFIGHYDIDVKVLGNMYENPELVNW